jgi:CRISPR/Cas system endoribonuclease Cas6 (RAMP superfamily)
MLTQEIRRRAEIAGISSAKKLKLFFDPNFRNAKTRLISIKSINIKASVCPVIAVGSPEALEFVWTVGAGEMCDLGFGSLNHTA